MSSSRGRGFPGTAREASSCRSAATSFIVPAMRGFSGELGAMPRLELLAADVGVAFAAGAGVVGAGGELHENRSASRAARFMLHFLRGPPRPRPECAESLRRSPLDG